MPFFMIFSFLTPDACHNGGHTGFVAGIVGAVAAG
jgi:hypothetical protein